MPSSGPNSPGTLVNDTGVAGVAWTNPGDAISSNNVRTYANGGLPFGTATTNYLKVTNFGFAIPLGATIDGIVVNVEKQSSIPNFTLPLDNICKLVKGGVVVGTNKASATNWVYNTDTLETYGGVADLWGTTWSVSEINASDFGFVISAYIYNDGKNGPGQAEIDYIRITIFYTSGGGGSSVSKFGLLGVG